MKDKLILGGVTSFNIIIRFVSQLIIYTTIGANSSTDAYIAAITVPTLIVGMVSVSLTSVLIPFFSGEETKKQNENAWNLLVIIASVFALITAILILTSYWWVRFIFPGFDSTTASLTVDLIHIQMYSMVFLPVTSVLIAVNNARLKFIYIELLTLIVVILNLIVMFFLLPRFGITGAAWLSLGSNILLFFILVPSIQFPKNLSISNRNTRYIWKRIKPMLLGNVYLKIDILIDRYLLSMTSEGNMAVFGLARQFYSAGTSIITKVWSATAIPHLSIYAKNKNLKAFLKLYKRRILILLVISVTIYLIFLLIGEFFLKWLVGYGAMSHESIHALWVMMVYLGGIFIFGCISSILTGAYYAIGDIKTPVLLSIVTFTIFIFSKYYIFQVFGIFGMCITISIYFFINTFLLWIIFPKKLKKL